MKRLTCLALSAILILALVSCSQQNADGNSSTSATGTQNSNSTVSTASITNVDSSINIVTQAPTEPAGSTDNTKSNDNQNKEELLQSTNADLDSDGKEESIQAIKVTSDNNGTTELEGLLRIKSSDATKDVTFIKKNEGMTGVMSSMDIRDLDGDGTKDIFVIVPDNGAAFSLNYFFLYSYKKDKSFTYNSDSDLADFTGGFSFKYAGGGVLEISNTNYNFSAKMSIVNKDKGIEANDENNSVYENSWVEPVPVVINENSRLIVVKGTDGKPEIKVPLPIFGQATADMIGEVDLYYRVDDNFNAAMQRFEVFDYTETSLVKVGGSTNKELAEQRNH